MSIMVDIWDNNTSDQSNNAFDGKNVLETKAGEKENIRSYLRKTTETSKDECNKQLLEKKEGNFGLCLKEDMNGCAISKEESEKQIILQRNETNESSIKLKMKNDLSNKLKVMSPERQDEGTKLNESNMLLYFPFLLR